MMVGRSAPAVVLAVRAYCLRGEDNCLEVDNALLLESDTVCFREGFHDTHSSDTHSSDVLQC